jgi:hypothetical protein
MKGRFVPLKNKSARKGKQKMNDQLELNLNLDKDLEHYGEDVFNVWSRHAVNRNVDNPDEDDLWKITPDGLEEMADVIGDIVGYHRDQVLHLFLGRLEELDIAYEVKDFARIDEIIIERYEATL